MDERAFYGQKRNICARCQNKDVQSRSREHRLRIVSHMGGHCTECGYREHLCSLDVHHLDPREKDPFARSMRGWSWERTVAELEKCILLCKNCHAAVHVGGITLGT